MHSAVSRRSLLRSSALVVGVLGFTQGPRLRGQGRTPYEVANCDVIAVSNAQVLCTAADANPVTLPIDRNTPIMEGGVERRFRGHQAWRPYRRDDRDNADRPATRTKDVGQYRQCYRHYLEAQSRRLRPVIAHGVGAPGQALSILLGDNVNVNNGLVTKAAISPGLRAQVIGQGLPGGTAGVAEVLATTILLHNKWGVMLGAEHLPLRRGSAQ